MFSHSPGGASRALSEKPALRERIRCSTGLGRLGAALLVCGGLFWVGVSLFVFAPPVEAVPATSLADPPPPVTATIALVGDVIPHERLVDSARDRRTGRYDFTPMFRQVAPYLAAADYTVANLETPLAGPAAHFTGYPLFNAPLELALALREAGVDLCTTANNHCLDRGWGGLTGTLDRLDLLGLAHTGTNRSWPERQTPLVVDIRGIRVAFLAYTQALNGHAPPRERQSYAVNLLAPDRVAADAALARLWGAEIVVAVLHWGEEYRRQPTAAAIALAEGMATCEGLLSRGIDVIVGHHPHVVQPIVKVTPQAGGPADPTLNRYVAYSLGNFLSNQPWRYSDCGLILYLHLEKAGFRARVAGISYLPVYVQRDVRRWPTGYRVLPVFPDSEPWSDLPLTTAQKVRAAQVLRELEPLVSHPEDGVRILDPRELDLLAPEPENVSPPRH